MKSEDMDDETKKAYELLSELPDSEAAEAIGCWAATTGYNLRKIAGDVDDDRYQAD